MKKLIFFLSAILAVTSCEKSPDMERLEHNYLVYTNHDVQTNFKAFRTFYLPQRILILSDSETPDYLKEETAGYILTTYIENMEERGYRLTHNKEEAELGIQISYIQSNHHSAGLNAGEWWWQHPCYWQPDFWGDWKAWYYPFETVYDYSPNSFLIEMVTLRPTLYLHKHLPVVWNSYLTGFEPGTRHVDRNLLTKAIRQSFIQSPYLRDIQ